MAPAVTREPVPVNGAVPWHAVEADEALRRLGSGPAGLDEDESARRLAEHGPNALQVQEGPGWVRILRDQFRSPLIATSSPPRSSRR